MNIFFKITNDILVQISDSYILYYMGVLNQIKISQIQTDWIFSERGQKI